MQSRFDPQCTRSMLKRPSTRMLSPRSDLSRNLDISFFKCVKEITLRGPPGRANPQGTGGITVILDKAAVCRQDRRRLARGTAAPVTAEQERHHRCS